MFGFLIIFHQVYSIEDVIKYFGDNGKMRVAKDLKGSTSWWWLRSPGSYSSHQNYCIIDGKIYDLMDSSASPIPAPSTNLAAYVSTSGEIFDSGKVDNENGGVRPALWLKVNFER